ncbi:hypothetical protein F4780DRAFT_203570 [Xylariomycetidae sp. FL0641]|nr:hypothetical protein F4780DRAFT_203570 [Xylariomycetidae sp. FL0641]
MRLPGLPAAILALLATCRHAQAYRNSSRLSPAAQSLFDYSMSVSDSRYDSSYDYIWYPSNGQWDTRFTAWYTPGLLYRAQGDDVTHAIAAIENLLATQMLEDFDSAWYGTYKVAPDAPIPTPNSTLFPPEIYETYDPNWREFIGSQLVQVVEEFGHLLSDDLIGRIEDSLEQAAIGGMRRNGTFPEGDNLSLGYSNPGIMRALVVGWIGVRRNNETYLDFARHQGNDLLALFQRDGQNVLAEYNAPNYYGIDMWALGANIQYGPEDMPMTTNARYMINETWKDIAAHFNPYLGNFAGPYDRAYTRDATTHSAIISMFWWGLWGREYGPQPPKGEADLLFDVGQGAALALVMETVGRCIDDETVTALQAKGSWEGSRFINKTIYDNLHNDSRRIATSWVSAPIMIGGETVAEDVNRGDQFVPAIVHWASDPEHKPYPYNGMVMLYPSASTVTAEAGTNRLSLAYPDTAQAGTDIFTLALTGIAPKWTLAGNVVTGLEELPCLKTNVSAPGLVKQPVTYGSMLHDHYIYNISYVVPDDFEGVPRVDLEFEYTCTT